MADELPVLREGGIVLRPWRRSDAPAVHAACQDRLIARFVPIPQPYTMADAEAFIRGRLAGTSEDGEAGFAIADAASDAILGAIARHGPFGHRAAFGYWLAPAARGRGVATLALRRIVRWTIETTDVIRFELYTDPANDASGRVAERAGFVREGVRQAWDLDREGRPIDSVFYVLVRRVDRPLDDPSATP